MAALLELFYEEQRDGSSTVRSRSGAQRTLMMHYALMVALIAEGYTMGPAEVCFRPALPHWSAKHAVRAHSTPRPQAGC